MNNELSAFWQAIEKTQSPLIISDGSGDALSAGLAMADFLAAAGKNTKLISSGSIDSRLSFLPGFDGIEQEPDNKGEFVLGVKLGDSQAKSIKYRLENDELLFTVTLNGQTNSNFQPFIKNAGYNHDLIITIGIPELAALGPLFEQHSDLFYQTDIINIDHNFANDNYGQLNILDLKAAAISEIVFGLLEKQQSALSDNSATCLMAGLISRTRNFKTGNITPRTLAVASTLVKLGANRDLIVTELYRKKSLKLLKLWGLVMAKLSASDSRQLIWTNLAKEQFEAAGGQESDLLSLVEEVLISLADTLAVVIFITDQTGSQAIVYSAKNLDANYLGQNYQATGSKKISHFYLDKNQSEQLPTIIQDINHQIEKITGR